MVYSSMLILIMLILGCTTKEISKTNSWYEKYGLEPNTGVLTGKITLNSIWKNKKVFIFLTNKWHGELAAYDSVSSNGYILIKNLRRGRYFIDAYPDSLYFIKPNVPFGSLGHSAFSGYNCKSFFIDIEPNQIKYIDCEVPGGYIDESPTIIDERFPPVKGEFLDSCELRSDVKELNENNYKSFYLLKRERSDKD